MTTLSARFTTVLLAVASLALLVCGIFNLAQQGYHLPSDGVSWLDSPEGVKAWTVTPSGAGYQAGIREGDRLKSINGKRVERALDAGRAVSQIGVWSRSVYDLDRRCQAFQTTVVITPETVPKGILGYLEIVGLLYLGITAITLRRRMAGPAGKNQ